MNFFFRYPIFNNMPKRIIILLILILLLITGITILLKLTPDQKNIESVVTIETDTSPQRKCIDEYAAYLAEQFDSTGTVGAAVTVVYKGRIMLMKPFGVKEAGKNDSVDTHTIFRLASVSKGFAGVLACMLEQKKLISMDEKISTIIPGFKLRDSTNTYGLTIEHILSHTTGLVPHAFDNLIEDGISYPLVLSELPMVEISAKPGVLYSYQNVIFSLLDSIVMVKTGIPYDELLERFIFKPLKMRDASANPDVFDRRRSNVAHPHRYNDTVPVVLPLNIGYYNLKPAAGVNASISDLSRWLLALLNYKPDVLDTAILRRIETPLIESPLKRSYLRQWDHIDSKYYSLGWRIYMYKGRKLIYHGGYVKGYRAEIAYCPEEKVGIAFLENSPNELASECIPQFFNRWFSQTDSTVNSIATGEPRIDFN
jgi:beta-lactamase class C